MTGPVRGHTCEGLAKFQAHGTAVSCVPTIDPRGVVSGCDDSNTPNPIVFCPFCGVRLPDAKWEIDEWSEGGRYPVWP